MINVGRLGPLRATPFTSSEMPVHADQIDAESSPRIFRHIGLQSFRPLLLGIGALLVLYLCWRIVLPFLPAICWAFALALIGQPLYAWLVRRRLPRNLAALSIIILATIAVLGPGVVLTGALAGEASDVFNRVTSEAAIRNVREAIDRSSLVGPAFHWLDSRYDLVTETMQLARSAAGWASAAISSVLTGSIWLVSQIAITLFVLFYFLRDGQVIVSKVRFVIPLSTTETDLLFTRIAQIIKVSLGGKLIVAGIQGTLGGLMFGWLGLPAPIFWGCVMAFFSVFPIIGAFVIWLPVAIMFGLQGDWRSAIVLVAWGVLIIHPVDNLLGPVLVGSALRMHTLITFFSIIGGLTAFGASGLVLGPVTTAVAVGLMELAQASRDGASIAGPSTKEGYNVWT